MKLYYAPGACSLAAHIALVEAAVPYTLEKVDLGAKRTAAGVPYLEVNAKGSVPALMLDDGAVLTENAVVLQYIADQQPGTALAPAHGTFARYRLIEWLNYIATEIHKGFGPLWNRALPAAAHDAARAALDKRFAYVAKRLASTPCLMDETFTVADAYLYTLLRWTGPLAIDIAAHPPLPAYMARIGARPGVQKALAEEGIA